MRACMEDLEDLHLRLNKVAGQIKAIDKMIEEEIPCEDILVQVNAARGALKRINQIILKGHLNHCIREGIEHGDAEKTLSSLTKSLEYFSRMT